MSLNDRTLHRRAMVATVVASLTLAACGSGEDPAESASTPSSPRLVLTSDGAVTVLDAATLEPVGDDVPVDGFLRVNPAGDGEHAYVTTADGFEVLATGATSGEDPAMTGLVFEGAAAGHVVLHDGRTTLFDDATGTSWTFDSDALGESDAEPSDVRTVESDEAHHGVAIELSDGTFLTTIGDEESRSGVRHLDADGEELARNEECPGVHGEGAAADERVMFGCEDGVLLFADGVFTKVDSPDEFGRVGNAYVTEESPVAIVDYKDDPDAEGVLLDRVAVVDTAAGTLDVADLPEGVAYTWQGVERAEDGTAWLVGTDGALHQLDETGAVVASHPVIDAWEGPAEWQDPHPYLVVHGDTGYVTEPASQQIHAVDLTTGEVVRTGSLDAAPNEMTITG